MAKEGNTTLRLGAFMVGGTLLLFIALYLLGNKRGLFSESITVFAEFEHVGGLQPGNNVRYAGINVGTVRALTIVNDSTVRVEMYLRESEAEHIHADAVASVGSDGLMGNKLVNIEPGAGSEEPLTDGAVLTTSVPLDTEGMMRTLDVTNRNLAAITMDLRDLTSRLNHPGSVLDLLADPSVADDLRLTVADIQATSMAARSATERVDRMLADVQAGKGALGTLVGDPVAEERVKSTLERLQRLSDSLAHAAGELDRFSSGLNDPDGLTHLLTQDSSSAADIRRSIANLEKGTELLNEDLKALQSNWFFRKYFKDQAKSQKHKGKAKP